MLYPNSLKFIKHSNGNVLLLKKETNHFIASFIPSLTINRDKDNLNRFEVMKEYIDYRTIDCDACTPVIVASNFDEFLMELSENFFFLNKKGCCNKFGRITLVDKGVNNCVLNTGSGLEIGDIVSLWPDLNTRWPDAKYLGGDLDDNDNFESYMIQNMGTTCSLPVDAVVSSWSSWSNCLEGSQNRTRTVITPATNGGTTPNLIETQSCSNDFLQVFANHGKNLQYVPGDDKIISTIKVYLDGILVKTDVLPMLNQSQGAFARGIYQLTNEGVTVTLEHIVEPTANDVAVKSIIKRFSGVPYNSPIISSETIIGTLGNVIINSVTFIMPNANVSLDFFASYIQHPAV